MSNFSFTDEEFAKNNQDEDSSSVDQQGSQWDNLLGKYFEANRRDYKHGDDTEEINDLRDRLKNGDYSNEAERADIINKMVDVTEQRQRDQNTYWDTVNSMPEGKARTWFTQNGGTIHGLMQQYVPAAIGAAGGAFLGRPDIGWKAGSGLGAIYGANYEAKQNAQEDYDKVLDMGGSQDDAQNTYDSSYTRNGLTTIPTTLMDVYTGNKIGNWAIGKLGAQPLADSIAKSTLGRGASALSNLDIPQRLGTFVAEKTGKPWLGKAVGVGAYTLADMFGEGSQEVEQNYASDSAINQYVKNYAPDKYNPNNSSIFSYNWTSPENVETFKQAAMASMPFAAFSGGVSRNQFLTNNTDRAGTIQFGKQVKKFIQDHPEYELDPNHISDLKNVLATQLGIDEDVAQGWDMEQLARAYRDARSIDVKENSILGKKYREEYFNNDLSTLAENDFINFIFKGSNQSATNMMSDVSAKFFKDFGKDRVQGMYSPTERQAQEAKARQQQVEKVQQAKTTSYTAKQSSDTDNTGTSIEIEKGLNKDIPTDSTQKPTNGNASGAGNGVTGKPSIVAKGKIFKNNTQTKEQMGSNSALDTEPMPETIGEWQKQPKRTVQSFEVKGDTYEGSDGTRLSVVKQPNNTYEVSYEGTNNTFNWGSKEDTIAKLEGGEVPTYSEQTAGNGLSNLGRYINQGGKKIMTAQQEMTDNSAPMVHNVNELTQYYKTHQNGLGSMSPRMYGQIADAMMRFGNKPIDYKLALDTFATNNGKGQVAGQRYWQTQKDGTQRAIVALYNGADVFTAVHEIAHVGWDLLSEQDKKDFRDYAIDTQADYVCKYLGVPSTKENVEQILDPNSELGKKFNGIDDGVMTQTKALLYPKATGKVLDRAVRERFAHEFSMLYARGREVGHAPFRIREIFDKFVTTIGKALGLIRYTSEYLKSPNWKILSKSLSNSPLTIFENISKDQDINNLGKDLDSSNDYVPLVKQVPPAEKETIGGQGYLQKASDKKLQHLLKTTKNKKMKKAIKAELKNREQNKTTTEKVQPQEEKESPKQNETPNLEKDTDKITVPVLVNGKYTGMTTEMTREEYEKQKADKAKTQKETPKEVPQEAPKVAETPKVEPKVETPVKVEETPKVEEPKKVEKTVVKKEPKKKSVSKKVLTTATDEKLAQLLKNAPEGKDKEKVAAEIQRRADEKVAKENAIIEAERKAKEEADKKALKAQKAKETKAKKAAEQKAKAEAEAKAKAEKEALAKQKKIADEKAKVEQEQKQKEIDELNKKNEKKNKEERITWLRNGAKENSGVVKTLQDFKDLGIVDKNGKKISVNNAMVIHYTPDDIIKGYSGYDRVISYYPEKNEVTVQGVEQKDGKWVDISGDVRTFQGNRSDYAGMVKSLLDKGYTYKGDTGTTKEEVKEAPKETVKEKPKTPFKINKDILSKATDEDLKRLLDTAHTLKQRDKIQNEIDSREIAAQEKKEKSAKTTKEVSSKLVEAPQKKLAISTTFASNKAVADIIKNKKNETKIDKEGESDWQDIKPEYTKQVAKMKLNEIVKEIKHNVQQFIKGQRRLTKEVFDSADIEEGVKEDTEYARRRLQIIDKELIKREETKAKALDKTKEDINENNESTKQEKLGDRPTISEQGSKKTGKELSSRGGTNTGKYSKGTVTKGQGTESTKGENPATTKGRTRGEENSPVDYQIIKAYNNGTIEKAEEMEEQGKSQREIFRKKGIFRGLDGQWRAYIPDEWRAIDIAKLDREGSFATKLEKVYENPQLYLEAPFLKDVTVRFDKSLSGSLTFGTTIGNRITLNPDYRDQAFKPVNWLAADVTQKVKNYPQSTLLHEVQHIIQDNEGLSSGTTFDVAKTNKDALETLRERYLYTPPSEVIRKKKLKEKIHIAFNINNKPADRQYSSAAGEIEARATSRQEILRQKKIATKQLIKELPQFAKREGVPLQQLKNDVNNGLKILSRINNRIPSIKNYARSIFELSVIKKDLELAGYSSKTAEDIRTLLRNVTATTDANNLTKAKEALNIRADEITPARQMINKNNEQSILLDKNGNIKGYSETKRGKTTVYEYGNIRFKNQSIKNSMISPDQDFSEAVAGEEVKDDKQNKQKKLPIKTIRNGSVLLQSKPDSGVIDHRSNAYKVTFTPTALNSTNNKKLVSQFEEAVQQWDKTDNPDGSVTFERIDPEKHQVNEITYNGINGKDTRSTRQKWKDRAQSFVIRWTFNDKEDLAKVARESGCWEAYMRMMVIKDQGNVAVSAMEEGIKLEDGTRTAALNDIIDNIGEVDQWDFLEYCEAKRVIDLANREQAVYQKMTVDEAQKIIEDVESGKNSTVWQKQQEEFVKYNRALLHILVDGNVLTEKDYNTMIEVDPNYIPLNKIMDGDMINNIAISKSLINTSSPIRKIKGSLREIKNPFLQMQENTAKFYAVAARNNAARTFVKEIAEAVSIDENGNEVKLNGALCKELAVPEEMKKNLAPDVNQRVFFIFDKGKKRYYQCADPLVYNALRSFDEKQIKNWGARAMKAFASMVRKTATATLDFGIRNIIRDNGEAFLTSEHGFIPVYDFVWGVNQIRKDSIWWKEFQSLNGEMLTKTKDGKTIASSGRRRTLKTLYNTFISKKVSPEVRAKAALGLVTFFPNLALNGIEAVNNVGEMATRVAEYKNARMGYNGLMFGKNSRLFGNVGMFNTDINKAKNDKYFATYKAKEITLNFGQHGKLGVALNPYVPFFNASLQGAYKVCRTLADLSGRNGKERAFEIALKGVLIGGIAATLHSMGHGHDDYDEAPDYEWKRFWILPNGIRIPKDQIFGQSIGTTVEMACRQMDKHGKVNKFDLLKNVLGTFAPDNFIPTIATLFTGLVGNYDTYKDREIIPSYMKDKLGYLHTDLNTSNLAADVSTFLWTHLGIDISSKKIDWLYRTEFSNYAKYYNAIYDLVKNLGHYALPNTIKGTNPPMSRGMKNSGKIADILKDKVPPVVNLVTGTFSTSNTSYQSISDFYDKYNKMKKYVTSEGKGKSKQVKIEKDSSGNPLIDRREWTRYDTANKQMKNFSKELRNIRNNDKLSDTEKREKADPIFKKQIKLAKWARGEKK